MDIVIGTAGWSVPASEAASFGPGSSALERYSTRFRGVEVNSSFHRPHRLSTWQRWSDSVPDDFRFAVKVPKTITHQAKLRDCDAPIDQFAGEIEGLGEKLAMLLVQLPPKLQFEAPLAEQFFTALAAAIPAQIVCEPRHSSWFEPAAEDLLKRLHIARVAADPACVPEGASPGGWPGFAYRRLHGSPRMYRSSYDDGRLGPIAGQIRADRDAARPSWCMFDNTASGAATGDALALTAELRLSGSAVGREADND